MPGSGAPGRSSAQAPRFCDRDTFGWDRRWFGYTEVASVIPKVVRLYRSVVGWNRSLVGWNRSLVGWNRSRVGYTEGGSVPTEFTAVVKRKALLSRVDAKLCECQEHLSPAYRIGRDAGTQRQALELWKGRPSSSSWSVCLPSVTFFPNESEGLSYYTPSRSASQSHQISLLTPCNITEAAEHQKCADSKTKLNGIRS